MHRIVTNTIRDAEESQLNLPRGTKKNIFRQEVVGRRLGIQSVRPSRRATVSDRSFATAGSRILNGLPDDVMSATCLVTFCRKLKAHLFRQSVRHARLPRDAMLARYMLWPCVHLSARLVCPSVCHKSLLHLNS